MRSTPAYSAIQQVIFILSCCLVLTSVHASSGASVSVDNTYIDLGAEIDWVEDDTNQLTFEQVRQFSEIKFNSNTQDTFNKGYTSSGYWLRFRLNFSSDLINSLWLLEIPFPLLDHVALYVPDQDDNYSVIRTGDRTSFSNRDLDTTNFVFKLQPQKAHNIYYLHVTTQDSLQVPLFLWNPDNYPKHNAYITGLQGLYFGIMIVMVFYNLFIYLSVREQSYLYYIAYIGVFTLFQASIHGYSFEYFWPNSTNWANISIPFLGVLSLFFASLFARNVLNTHELLPRADKVISLTAGGLFFTLPLILFASYTVGIIAALITTFIFFNLVFVTALLAALKRNRTARVFLIAWSIFLISGAISILGILNILPLEYANLAAIQIGSAIEVILLSIALADRINLIEKEKTEIEAVSRDRLLNANKQLEKSIRLKDEFIATISHEIRTPMNGVLGSAHLLLDTRPSEEQSLYIDTINHSGQTLLEILNNILDYSKIEADKLELESTEFSVEEMINECADCFSIVAAQNNVKLFVRIHKNTPSRIISDRVRFKQILLNLISNAFKFTSEGQVVIRIQLAKNSKKHLYIEVEDSGCGLTDEQQAMLFKPFVQVDASSSRINGGTGLGLAISKKLTDLMQGDIGVNSSLGKGAIFWFTAAVDIIQETDDNSFTYNKTVSISLSDSYQETLIKEQLQDWNIKIGDDNLLDCSHESNVITDSINLPELLATGIPEKNIIIITDDSIKINTGLHRITSPITPQKLRHSLRACQSPQFNSRVLNMQNEKDGEIADLSQLRVLAIDDNAVNRMIIKKMLSKYKIDADISAGGLEAMELIREQHKRYDLIFMDIEMPIQDGYQTTKDIRIFEKNNNLESCKIVAVSAHSIKESRDKALESGMNDFLSKPIDHDIFIELLTSTLTEALNSKPAH